MQIDQKASIFYIITNIVILSIENEGITNKVLICSITPYFLEKGLIWFEENLNKILDAQKTQAFFEENIIYLEKDQNYNVSQLLRKLDEMGYEKVLEIMEDMEILEKIDKEINEGRHSLPPVLACSLKKNKRRKNNL